MPKTSEHTTEEDPASICLGYLTCPKDGAGRFLGALLITDARTVPLAFTFVEPIHPTLIQRILYGRVLESHLRINIIAKSLAASRTRALDVLFVDAPELLAARSFFDAPTAYLSPLDSKRPGVRLAPYRYDTGDNTADQDAVGKLVSRLDMSVDLLDPFRRIEEALQECLKELKQKR